MVEVIKGFGYDVLVRQYNQGNIVSFRAEGKDYQFNDKGILCRAIYETKHGTEKPRLEILSLEEIDEIGNWSAINLKPSFPISTEPLSKD